MILGLRGCALRKFDKMECFIVLNQGDRPETKVTCGTILENSTWDPGKKIILIHKLKAKLKGYTRNDKKQFDHIPVPCFKFSTLIDIRSVHNSASKKSIA